ncbi:MAG: hypothetical protein LBI45_04825 [Bacteroidales bacterium]|jgi:antitoxin component YwqK of YwqJK toxin-antitoxin module|nr:hypothetical protein [Bacteroidales bacterium]
MKNTYLLSTNIFSNCLLFFSLLICFNACSPKKPKPVFELNTPGGEVVASYNDTLPQIVVFYKVDENGNKTHEIIGEAHYYENKQERKGGGLKNGKRDGKWYAFFKDGSVQTDAFYIEGKEHGIYNVYREDGKPYFRGHFDHGNCDGTWYYYDETGKQTRKIIADENTMACEYCQKCLKLKQK